MISRPATLRTFFAFLCLLVASTVAAQSRTAARDVWIAVITENGGLAPVSALVDGRWWDWLRAVKDGDAEPARARPRFVDGVTQRRTAGEESRPLGKPMPTSWQAYLFDGSRTSVKTSGRVKSNFPDEHRFVLETDFTSSLENIAPLSFMKGVAVAGAVEVSAFVEVAGPRRAELLRAWEPRILDEPGTPQDLKKIKLELQHFVWARHRDGSTAYFLRGRRSNDPNQSCGLQTSVIAHGTEAGEPRIDRVILEPYCDAQRTLQPLAVLERHGTRCWLSEWGDEDGANYAVTKAEQVFDYSTTGSADCDLRD